MKDLLKTFPAVAMLVLAAGCGAPPPEEEEQVIEQPVVVAVQESPEAIEGTRTVVGVEFKRIVLREDRYFGEMISEELSEAYREQRGEYIDPRRVIELLEESAEEPPAEEAESAEPAVTRSWRISYMTHREALIRFEEGDLAGAAGLWRELITDRRAFTLSVEVDCDPSILRSSFDALLALEAPVFCLPVAVAGGECYRLCVGVFAQRSEALSWRERVRTRLPSSHPHLFLVLREDR